MNFDHHPCFNPDACKSYGRIHLPVAPRCNIQCRFCNRKFDCVNETRPGVTSAVLSPAQAMAYLEQAADRLPNISVVGIAGPGDPFANSDKTLETMAMVRSKYPEMILCVATNGLNLAPHVDALKEINVSHVTVTVNCVDPAVGAKIYSWMRPGKRVVGGEEGAGLLLERQLEGIRKLKSAGMVVKINSIILPGINEGHMEQVARRMAELKVDLFNAMPYFPNPGSEFEDMPQPGKAMVEEIRKKAAVHVPQMRHCTRCRADAAGLLGDAPDKGLMNTLAACARLDEKNTSNKTISSRPNVAVASMEGVLVNQHLGRAEKLLVYGEKQGRVQLLEVRNAPAAGGGTRRWQDLAEILSDCSALLAGSVGTNPRMVLAESGIRVLEIEGLIQEAVRAVLAGESLDHMTRRDLSAGGACCSGNGMGCG